MARIRRLTGARAWAVRLSGLFVMAAIAALVVAMLPAFGASVPKEDLPLGGEGEDCSAAAALEDPDAIGTFPYTHLDSPPLEDFRIENPVNGTFTDPDTGAQFTLAVRGGGGKEFDWSTAQLMHGVIVKGGQKSVLYDYFTIGGPTSSDTVLVGPDKSNGKSTFNVSHVTFCYELVTATVSGTVWHDNDQDGGIGDGDPVTEPFEFGQGLWTVNLYEDGNPAPVATTTSDEDDGTYSFPERPFLGPLTVCEEAPSGQWAQAGAGDDVGTTWEIGACGNGSEEPDGHVVTTAGLTTANFGNFITENGGCGDTFGPVGHEITLPDDNGQANSLCTKPDAEWVVETYTRANGAEVHDFHPVGGFEEGEEADVTEVHVFSLDLEKEQETGRTLMYDDGAGGVEAALCEIDPTTGGVLDPDKVNDALDPTGGPDGGPDTTCIITFTKNSDDTITFFLYSKIDGRRFF